MKLKESDPLLSEVCCSVETHVRSVSELADLELPVLLLPNFDSLPELKKEKLPKVREILRLSPVLYRRNDRTILVNSATFFSFSPDVADGVVAHEIGHAVCHRDLLTQRVPEYQSLSECIVADLLACKWSFADGLRKERLESNGQLYCDILELWPNEDEFVRRMSTWYRQRLARIL